MHGQGHLALAHHCTLLAVWHHFRTHGGARLCCWCGTRLVLQLAIAQGDITPRQGSGDASVGAHCTCAMRSTRRPPTCRGQNDSIPDRFVQYAVLRIPVRCRSCSTIIYWGSTFRARRRSAASGHFPLLDGKWEMPTWKSEVGNRHLPTSKAGVGEVRLVQPSGPLV